MPDEGGRLAELETLSRQRALTKAESYELERELCFADGRRLPRGLTRVLAKYGVKRDMRRFSPPPKSHNERSEG